MSAPWTVVSRVDFHQHGAFSDVLVVFRIYLDYITGNARADGIEMNIHLCIVRRLVAAQIASEKKASENDGNTGNPEQNSPAPFRSRREVRLRDSFAPG